MSVILAPKYEDEDHHEKLPEHFYGLPVQEDTIETTDVTTHDSGYKHFGYAITSDQHKRRSNPQIDEPFTTCDDCGTRLWKNVVSGVSYCPDCGLVYEDSGGTPSWTQKGGVNGGESGLQHGRYDGSRRIRLFGGYFKAYVGDGEYEFGNMDTTFVD